MAAKPILQRGSCWRVGNGETIRILKDAWLPSSPTNKVLHPVQNIEEGMMVAELIDPVSWWWDREFILRSFNRKEAEAILRVPLSCRYTPDTLFWLAEKSGEYSVRTGYHVAQRLIKELDWTKCSMGLWEVRVWKVLWKLKVPNEIKVFGWRACCNILPTQVNLIRKRIIEDNRCEACKTEPETKVHALWNCGVAQDIWAGCSVRLQKCCGGQDDML